MPIYEYVCSKKHLTVRIVVKPSADEPTDSTPCATKKCNLSAGLVCSATGTPILKAGKGGFYSPNA